MLGAFRFKGRGGGGWDVFVSFSPVCDSDDFVFSWSDDEGCGLDELGGGETALSRDDAVSFAVYFVSSGADDKAAVLDDRGSGDAA